MWPTKKVNGFLQKQKLGYNNTNEWSALINFLESFSDSEYTRRSYLSQLNKFMKFCHVQDPEELLLWDQKVIGDKIIKFVIQCRKEDRVQHSIHAYYASIKHFYEMNDVVLN
jgi:site-specific recombinase XerD